MTTLDYQRAFALQRKIKGVRTDLQALEQRRDLLERSLPNNQETLGTDNQESLVDVWLSLHGLTSHVQMLDAAHCAVTNVLNVLNKYNLTSDYYPHASLMFYKNGNVFADIHIRGFQNPHFCQEFKNAHIAVDQFGLPFETLVKFIGHLHEDFLRNPDATSWGPTLDAFGKFVDYIGAKRTSKRAELGQMLKQWKNNMCGTTCENDRLQTELDSLQTSICDARAAIELYDAALETVSAAIEAAERE